MQTLQLVPLDFREPPSGQHKDSALTRQLAEAVRIDAEVVARLDPSSHQLRVANEILSELLFRNYRVGGRLQEFRKRDAMEFLSSPRNLVHYAGATIARDLYRQFEQTGLDLGLLSRAADDEDCLEVAIEGKTPKTVLRGYERKYRALAVERMAHKRAADAVVAEFHQKQTNLSEILGRVGAQSGPATDSPELSRSPQPSRSTS